MMYSTLFRMVCVAAIALNSFVAVSAEKEIQLWPGTAPGEKAELGESTDTTKPTDRKVANGHVVRLGNISHPTLTFFPASPTNNTHAAVLVCPGGGYNILASNLEGTEVCEWLNSLGINAALLKYRVPRREGLEKHMAPLQDAQRAMGLIRSRAKEWNIDSKRVGVIGFSAGGHLGAALSTAANQRTYPKADAADEVNCRPDFSMLIYPAYLAPKEDLTTLSQEVAVTTNHPPTFLVMTQDDGQHMENVLTYALALQRSKIPVELHLYPKGGHGYGLRRTDMIVTTWPDRAKDWLRFQKIIP